MKTLFNFMLTALIVTGTSCTNSKKERDLNFTMKVWENGTPEDNGISETEYFKNDSSDVFNISEAELSIFLVDNNNTGNMVLICPGGGYGMQAIKKEGWDMAKWLNERGINAAVLKYRLPNGHKNVPLSDAQESMRIIRKNSQEWGINKVGVCGYSAGGHLASTLATKYDKETRPEFQILFYPVISFGDSITHKGSRRNLLGEANINENTIHEYSSENFVSKDSPKAIIFLCDDDKSVVPANSENYKAKLDECGISCELYRYATGGHGWGTLKSFAYYDDWTATLDQWLKKL